MITHKGYIVIVVYIVHVRAVISDQDKCDYFCDADGCQTANSNNVPNSDSIKFCSDEDIPNDVNIIPTDHQNGTNFLGEVQVHLTPPKGVCKYQVILVANESINEKSCMSYDFQNIYTKLHSENTICFISNNNEHQHSVVIPFRYIFTACYRIRISYSSGTYRYVGNNSFLTTNHNRTEVVQPKFKCLYNILPNKTKEHNEVYFEIEFSTSIVEIAVVRLRHVYTYENEPQCRLNSDNMSHNYWSFDVLEEYMQHKRANSNTSLITSGVYERKLNFTIESLEDRRYCVIIGLWDRRCASSSIWKSPGSSNYLCEWFVECRNISGQYRNDVNNNANFYLLLSIVIIMLSMLLMLGIVYCICMIYNCNVQEIKHYVSPGKRNVKADQHKYNKVVMCGLKETENQYCDNVSNARTDIVLLYPKSSESFMTLMADFRGILGTVCQCFIHDWYDGIQWNHVAEIGGSDWFAEILNSGACVIWIDTPTTRSLIKRRFQKDFGKSSEQHNHVEIGDFRDIVFPIIFTLAKRNVDASMIQRHKHFIVRLKGFENFEDEDDPFVDLSSHKRYLIPLDLSSLCSDLSIVNFDAIMPITSKDEDLIKQHIYRMEHDFRK